MKGGRRLIISFPTRSRKLVTTFKLIKSASSDRPAGWVGTSNVEPADLQRPTQGLIKIDYF